MWGLVIHHEEVVVHKMGNPQNQLTNSGDEAMLMGNRCETSLYDISPLTIVFVSGSPVHGVGLEYVILDAFLAVLCSPQSSGKLFVHILVSKMINGIWCTRCSDLSLRSIGRSMPMACQGM